MLTFLWSRPGQVLLPGVLAFQQTPDSATLRAGQAHALDSVATNPKFADPVVAVVQFIFQQSPLVMWGGVVLGAILAAIILVMAWRRREGILHWLRTRPTAVKVAMVSAIALVAVVGAALGYQAYGFVENDKRFCNGCHIFVPSGGAWVQPDTGNYTLVNLMEGKHDTLSCHACHTLQPFKEAVKMFWWMSGHREDEIPPHAKVPRTICESCHVQGDAKETWQEVATTAGHRVHLESDSTALDSVQCITCHAQEVHRFIPVNTTCSQEGCHEDTKIILGDMARESVALEAHCTACHQFTAEVPRLATVDSARGTLVPGDKDCLACHQMQNRLADFDPARDPHAGSCGTCHDPHAQATVEETRTTCASANCHVGWRDIPFHVGPNHRRVGSECTLCHQPHAARVDASDCTGCHTRVSGKPGVRSNLPLPFDTTAAKQQAYVAPPGRLVHGKGDAPLDDPPPGAQPDNRSGGSEWGGDQTRQDSRPVSPMPAAVADTFSHDQHKALNCITCHRVASGEGPLTFTPPRGCQICHHQAPSRSQCRECHESSETAPVLSTSVTVTVPRQPARSRDVGFRHETHDSLACTECHTQPVTLEPTPAVTGCVSCHEQHHEPGSDCATCHQNDALRPAHERPVQAHTGCDACHTPRTIARLVPTRSLCLTCHQDQQQDHYEPRECTVCHLQATPEAYRAHLKEGGP